MTRLIIPTFTLFQGSKVISYSRKQSIGYEKLFDLDTASAIIDNANNYCNLIATKE